MTIDMLDRGTILVSLDGDDMRRYALRFDDEAAVSVETGLKKLLYRVGEVCGLDHRGKSYLIEALPSPRGWLLIISVHTVKRRRKYRIKRSHTGEICVFFHADAMLDYLHGQKHRRRGCVYRYEGRYVLLPSQAANESELAQLSEYGELYPVSAATLARVREHGKLLWQEDVQRSHISAGTVAVRNAALGNADG